MDGNSGTPLCNSYCLRPPVVAPPLIFFVLTLASCTTVPPRATIAMLELCRFPLGITASLDVCREESFPRPLRTGISPPPPPPPFLFTCGVADRSSKESVVLVVVVVGVTTFHTTVY